MLLSGSVSDSVREIRLDAERIRVRKAQVTFNQVTYPATPKYEEDLKHLLLSTSKRIGPGEVQIQVEYEGTVGTNSGLFFAGKNNEYVVTQLEPISARSVFPCVDEPRYKTPFDLELSILKNAMAFSNAPVDARYSRGDRDVVRFKTTPKASTYQLALVVGSFETYALPERHLRLLVPNSQATSDPQRTLALIAKSVDRAERLLAIPHGLEKVDVVGVPDFPVGGMENPGLIFLSLDSLNSPNAPGLIAHEVAHLWFGDLVTPATWEDLWLSEGFASWLAPALVTPADPTKLPALDLQNRKLSLKRARFAFHGDEELRSAFGSGGTQNAQTWEESLTVSVWILSHLTYVVGHDQMVLVMRSYLRKHRFSTATFKDFDADFKSVTGRSVDAALRAGTAPE
jgi:alanyl aminopeptidase